MKISTAELFHVSIPLIRPFETSHGEIRERSSIIIKLASDDGTTGYGESSPLPELTSDPETMKISMEFLRDQTPKLLGTPIVNDYNITTRSMREAYPASCIGLESAYIDLLTKTHNITLASYFGATASCVFAAESASLRNTPEETVQEVRGYLAIGTKRIKIKIAPGRDRSIIDAIHQAFPELCFGLDANAAYTMYDVRLLASFTANHYISFVEQPFHADDYESHALLRKHGVTVCLDETIRNIETCKKSIDAGACDIVNIKPARIGSFSEAKHIHDECVIAGVRIFGGGRLETGVAKTINAAFYALPGFTDPSDITPPTEYLAADIIDHPFAVTNGVHKIQSSSSIGIYLNETIVQSFLKEKIVLKKIHVYSMLTQQEILNYHIKGQKNNACGFEFEIFCLNKRYQRLFFNNKKKTELQNVFNYLISDRKFKKVNSDKTIGVAKDGANFTLEPGSQLEYSSRQNENAAALVKEFLQLLKMYNIFFEKFTLHFSDLSLFPSSGINQAPLLPAARYEIMDKYFLSTGTLGKTMMRGTTSLQLTFSYESKQDLEKKINRLLFLKPILLAISSNSRFYDGKNSKYRSFRDVVWKNTDPKRCGDPGKDFWASGQWTIENYIEKVLDAPVIFDVKNKQYQSVPAQPFRNLMRDLNIESYIFHNSTIFTDVRIKNYVEIRYLDNPTILLVPGIILLVESVLNDDKTWNLLCNLPYKFEEVPELTKKLNSTSKESCDFWNKSMRPVLSAALDNLKSRYPQEIHFYLNTMIEKINAVGNLANLKIDKKNILEKSINQFNNNLAKLLANT